MTELSPLDFYNSFRKKLTYDFLTGNKRIESVLNFILKNIDFKGMAVLDIGCGLGWSSYEISRVSNIVKGLDLSPDLIKTAQILFERPNLEFLAHDITSGVFLDKTLFDCIIMIDVFEHINRVDRHDFTVSLSNYLKEKGILFLSCPSVNHQNYLRQNNPDGLQPIDEDVTLYDLIRLSDVLNAEIVYFGYQSIWESNDYFYCIIQRKPLNYRLVNSSVHLLPKNKRMKIARKAGLFELFSKAEIEDIRKRNSDLKVLRIKNNIKMILRGSIAEWV
jgi:SAM-dependent methyltransferase